MYGLKFSQKKNLKKQWHSFRLSVCKPKIMLKSIFIYLVTGILLLLSFQTQAQYKHQAGVRLGSIDQALSTGFSYRYFLNEKSAIEGIVNLKSEAIGLGALYERFNPISGVEGLQWFYGAGAYVAFEGNNNFGATGIIGMDYTFPAVPINLSVDWKPELNIIDNVAFRASTVAVSVRFAFGKK
jgi:hypothetical protein